MGLIAQSPNPPNPDQLLCTESRQSRESRGKLTKWASGCQSTIFTGLDRRQQRGEGWVGFYFKPFLCSNDHFLSSFQFVLVYPCFLQYTVLSHILSFSHIKHRRTHIHPITSLHDHLLYFGDERHHSTTTLSSLTSIEVKQTKDHPGSNW